MKRVCIFALILAVLLSFTACDGKIPFPNMTEHFTQPTATEEADPTKPKDGLSEFRSDMEQSIMAVADFGFPELSDEFGIMDYLLDEYPNWMEAHGFIQNIPEDRIILTCGYEAWGNLMCIVPKDPEAIICVTLAPKFAEEKEVYRSENGEPILILADISEETSVRVSVTDSSGQTVSYTPYWEYLGDEKFDRLVMDFTPLSEKTAYQNAVGYGWIVPDESFRTNHYWQSDHGYQLELYYDPGEIYDGYAYIYEDDGTGYYVSAYQGFWRYANGMLHLDVKNYYDESISFQADLPILTDPFEEGWLGIFRTEDGAGLPCFDEYMEYDELAPISSNSESPYEDALAQGWGLPELTELTDTFWLSQWCGYALELAEDSVPGDNGGWAKIYDVDDVGAYTESYSGSWWYEDGLLHLSLVPEFGDGVLVDDSFPVLMLDGELKIGRTENGTGLPHFYSDTLMDTLEQPKG